MKRETIVNTLALMGWAPRRVSNSPRTAYQNNSYILVNDAAHEMAFWLYPSYARLALGSLDVTVRESMAIEWRDLPSSTLMQLYNDLVK